MKKVGVLGSGQVGEVLANGFLKHGYEVMRGSREPTKLDAWKAGAGAKAHVGDFAATARFGEIVVLCVKGTAAEAAVAQAGVDNLKGKTILDATNPLADAPPVDGVLSYFTGPNESLMERLQKKAPGAHFVKAFSSVGNANFVNPDFGGTRPTMFICGDDAASKREAVAILAEFGWDSDDVGGVTSARAIEPLCMLWCLPGFLNNRWTHAFKVLTR
jgi:predicted dinucleotide-binding enzyme